MEWLLIVLALVAWGWYSGTVVKEVAVSAAKRACERHHQQLLDQTVALNGVRLRRDRNGRLRFLRRYSFEFSGDGESRHHGEVELLGRWVVRSNLELEGFTLYEQEKEAQNEPPR